tara:strand:- start:1420 stop:1611 length:192 start_codon:yes stop_codon:yes gene_type:complete
MRLHHAAVRRLDIIVRNVRDQIEEKAKEKGATEGHTEATEQDLLDAATVIFLEGDISRFVNRR